MTFAVGPLTSEREQCAFVALSVWLMRERHSISTRGVDRLFIRHTKITPAHAEKCLQAQQPADRLLERQQH